MAILQDNSEISIVIVSYNSDYYLERVLKSVDNFNDIANCEVIIIDNSTKNLKLDYLENFNLELKYIKTGENLGFGRANNLGVRESNYKNILLLNLDAQINVKISEIVNSLETHCNSLIGALMFNDDGISVPSYGCFPNSVISIFMPSKMYSISKKETSFEVDWIEASFLAFNIKVWDKVGGFDEDIFMYGEDLVLSFDAKIKGVDVQIDPKLTYFHTGGYNDSKYGNIFKGILIYLKRVGSSYSFFLQVILHFSMIFKLTAFSLLSVFKVKYRSRAKSILKNFYAND